MSTGLNSFVIAAALLVSGCVGHIASGSPGKAPPWVATLSGIEEGGNGRFFLYGVGSAQATAGDLTLLRKIAAANARAQLAEALGVHVKELVESYHRSLGATPPGTLERVDQAVSSQFTDADLPPHSCGELWPVQPAVQLKKDMLFVRCRIGEKRVAEIARRTLIPESVPRASLERHAHEAFDRLSAIRRNRR